MVTQPWSALACPLPSDGLCHTYYGCVLAAQSPRLLFACSPQLGTGPQGPHPVEANGPIPSHIPDKRAVVTQPNCIPAASGPLIPSAFPWGLTRPRTVKCRSQFGNSGSDISSVTFHLWVWTGPPSLWLSCQRPESWSCLPPVLGFTASPVASVRPTEAHSSHHLLPQLQPGSWRWLSPPSPTPSWSRRS